MKDILKYYAYITTSLFTVGALYNITDNAFDIYQLWIMSVLYVSIYLIETK